MRLPRTLCVLLLLGCCLPGCAIMQVGVRNPIPGLQTVAVAPFFNLSTEKTANGREFANCYYSELQKVPGFEVIPIGVTEQAMREFRIEMNGPEDALRLAEILKVDAVVIGAITDYDPYVPRLGLKVAWYSPASWKFLPTDIPEIKETQQLRVMPSSGLSSLRSREPVHERPGSRSQQMHREIVAPPPREPIRSSRNPSTRYDRRTSQRDVWKPKLIGSDRVIIRAQSPSQESFFFEADEGEWMSAEVTELHDETGELHVSPALSDFQPKGFEPLEGAIDYEPGQALFVSPVIETIVIENVFEPSVAQPAFEQPAFESSPTPTEFAQPHNPTPSNAAYYLNEVVVTEPAPRVGQPRILPPLPSDSAFQEVALGTLFSSYEPAQFSIPSTVVVPDYTVTTPQSEPEILPTPTPERWQLTAQMQANAAALRNSARQQVEPITDQRLDPDSTLDSQALDTEPAPYAGTVQQPDSATPNRTNSPVRKSPPQRLLVQQPAADAELDSPSGPSDAPMESGFDPMLPLMSHIRLFDAADSELQARLADYVELSGETRTGDLQAFMRRSDFFMKFTTHVMVSDMLAEHGGEARRRWVLKPRQYR